MNSLILTVLSVVRLMLLDLAYSQVRSGAEVTWRKRSAGMAARGK